MDTRNSAIVVGLYVVGGAIIAAVALGYFAYERSSKPSVLAVNFEDSDGRRKGRGFQGGYASADYYHASLVKANQSLRELQTSLAASRDKIEKQNRTIHQKNSECQALKEELNGTFTLLINLLADESSDVATTRESANQAKTKVEAELDRLLDALKQAEVLGAEQQQQLTRLRTDLLRADQELANVYEQSELEISAVVAERKSFEMAVTEIVAQCGAAAVPVLVDKLKDGRVEVRRWAVKTLGVMGPDAQEVLDVIGSLASDPDSTVREEARRAIAAISEA